MPLGEWVLRQACLRQVAWRAEGRARLRMAVNVSVRQSRDGDFTAVAERVLRESGAAAPDIELEITESHAMEDARVLHTAEALRGMDRRPDSRSIASMIVKMGHELGLDVLAEGVADRSEEAALRELGCDEVQGFLYAKSLPAAELESWLENRPGP